MTGATGTRQAGTSPGTLVGEQWGAQRQQSPGAKALSAGTSPPEARGRASDPRAPNPSARPAPPQLPSGGREPCSGGLFGVLSI